jgi:hypothetical protein
MVTGAFAYADPMAGHLASNQEYRAGSIPVVRSLRNPAGEDQPLLVRSACQQLSAWPLSA